MKETCCAFYFLSVSELPQGTNITLTLSPPYCNSFPFNFDHLVIISLHYCAVSSLLFILFARDKKIFSIKNVSEGLATSLLGWTILIILWLLMLLGGCSEFFLLFQQYCNHKKFINWKFYVLLKFFSIRLFGFWIRFKFGIF